MVNRVMRLNNNPKARGFVVRVLEETGRIADMIQFRCIASEAHGTKKAAERAYDRLKAEYIGR